MQTLLKTSILVLLGAFVLSALGAEETAIVNEGKVNVRGQPSLVGEVVTQLQRGDQVTVLEYVKNERAKGGEPTNWARIKLPANTPVWVYAPMVKDGAVFATRLNLRAGPGDNYSVIGRLGRGDKLNVIRSMGDWNEIEAPSGAYAFVDASLLKPSSGGGAAAPVPAAPVVATNPQQGKQPFFTPVPEGASAGQAKPSEPIPAPTATQPSQETVANAAPSQPTPETAAAVAAITGRPVSQPEPHGNPEPPQVFTEVTQKPAASPESAAGKRIVRREGIVRPTRSIQAPTWYELISPQTKKTIDYLHEEKLGLKLKQFKGQKVIVSGEEAIDPRWPNTPILEMETLDIAP